MCRHIIQEFYSAAHPTILISHRFTSVIPNPLSIENPDWTFIAWGIWVAFNLALFAFIKVKHPMARASQRKAMDFIFYDVAVFGSAMLIDIVLWYYFPNGAYAEALFLTLRSNLIIFPYLGLWVVLMAFFSDISRASRRSIDYRPATLLFLTGLGIVIFMLNLS